MKLPLVPTDFNGQERQHRTLIATAVNDLIKVRPPHDISAGEIEAGVRVVDQSYPHGCVDRYGTNEIPGTTDMTPAFNAAYQVAQQTGCGVTFGATTPYYLASPVNCREKRGIITRDLSSKKQANAQPSIFIGHTGHGFDLSCSTEMSFYDMVAENEDGVVPNTLFFMARNEAGSGADFHRFINIRTGPHCTFRHVFYNYGSEQSLHIGCSIYNAQPGSTCYNHNSTNPALYTSSFGPIASGAMSNVRHVHLGCDYFNVGDSGSSNEVSMSVERTGNLTMLGCMLYAPNGLAYIRVDGTIGSNFLTIIGCRGEANAAAATLAAIAVRTTAATGSDVHAHWIIENMSLDTASGGYLIDCNDTSDFLDLSVRGCVTSSGNHLLLHSATYSIFEHHQQAVTGLSGGTVSNCEFVGNRAVVSLTASSVNNVFLDQTLGELGGNAVRFPATQVPSADPNTLDDYEEGTWTPALTIGTGSVSAYTTQRGTYTKVGRQVTAQCFIEVNTVTGGPTGTLKISGLPFTSSAGLKGAISIAVNTFGTVATPVMGVVDPSATTASIFVLAAGTLGNPGANVGAGTQVYATLSYET
jgi:hypothetical protein